MILPARFEHPLAAKYEALVSALGDLKGAIVAFSGGVDSTFVLRAGVDALGPRVRAVLGRSPSVPEASLARARELCRGLGVSLEEIETREMDKPEYVRNAADRCFHCKDTLFQLLERLSGEAGGWTVLDGTNGDDLNDTRPGREAARLRGVRSPLAELGWTKEEIREASRWRGLPTWNAPSSPCLSSRLPHGTPVTLEALRRVERAEERIRRLGFPVVRVRHHGDLARVEVPPAELTALLERREDVVAAARSAGYLLVTLDLVGYRTGGADPALPEGRDHGPAQT